MLSEILGMSEEQIIQPEDAENEAVSQDAANKPRRGRPPIVRPAGSGAPAKLAENKIVRLLEKNPLGMTLPEMAGGVRQIKRIKTLRPLLADAIRTGLIMPVSQRAGHTVYKLVKNMGPR
jgi:transposase